MAGQVGDKLQKTRRIASIVRTSYFFISGNSIRGWDTIGYILQIDMTKYEWTIP